MERAIYLGSLQDGQTLNPAYGTVAVQPENTYSLDGNMRHRFSVPDNVDLFATLDLESLEPGRLSKSECRKAMQIQQNPFPPVLCHPTLPPLQHDQFYSH